LSLSGFKAAERPKDQKKNQSLKQLHPKVRGGSRLEPVEPRFSFFLQSLQKIVLVPQHCATAIAALGRALRII
jgi:hypothetical protein